MGPGRRSLADSAKLRIFVSIDFDHSDACSMAFSAWASARLAWYTALRALRIFSSSLRRALHRETGPTNRRRLKCAWPGLHMFPRCRSPGWPRLAPLMSVQPEQLVAHFLASLDRKFRAMPWSTDKSGPRARWVCLTSASSQLRFS